MFGQKVEFGRWVFERGIGRRRRRFRDEGHSSTGKDQKSAGTTVCTTTGGTVNIAIGGAAAGIGAVLTDASPPEVKSVALGNVNGVSLGYAPGTPDGNASATKNGNAYKISGTATGVDMANPMQPVKKPFEIDVTCSG